jgi:simple sugar transport system permease protein
MRLGRVPEPIVRAGFVAVCILVGVPLLLGALGFDAGPAMLALFRGSLGSGYAITSATLVRATPVILTGLAVAIAFRAGVFNIGAEGQLLAGAAAAAAVAQVPGVGGTSATPWIALLIGAGAGGLWAGIAALLRARFHVLEVISTILLNFLALYGVGFLVHGPLQEPLHIYPQSSTIAPIARLPRLAPTSRLHVGFLLAVGAAIAAWWVLRYTAIGFRLRAVGANPNAARVAGQIDVSRTTTGTFIVSGALAGLAGAIEVTGVTYALYESISPGYGYTGIAVALLARLDPRGVIVSGLVFGALEAGASAMQRDAGVPSVTVSIIEAVIILGLVAAWPLQIGTSRRAAGGRDRASSETREI